MKYLTDWPVKISSRINRLHPGLIFIVFIALSLAVFGNSIAGDFVFDDRVIVRDRPELRDISHLPRLLMEPYHYLGYDADAYRPLTMISYSLNFAFLGDSSYGFHLVNVLLHALAAWIIFIFLWRLTGEKITALAASALFLVLPIHTEAVDGIVGRAEILSLIFSFWCLIVLIRGRKGYFPREKGFGPGKTKAEAGLLFLLALLAKESAAGVLPLYFLIIELYLIEERGFLARQKIILKKYRADFLYLAGAFGLYLMLRFSVLDRLAATRATIVENPLKFTGAGERIITAVKIFWMYLEKIIWPINNLSSDYSYNQIPADSSFLDPGFLFGLAVFAFCAGIMVLALAGKRRYRLAALAAGIFMAFYLPIANIFFPVGTIMGERLMYIPSLGVCLLAGALLGYVYGTPEKKRLGILAAAAFAGLMVFYGWQSFVRNFDWLSEKSLFASAAGRSPESVLSRSNNGAIYLLAGNLSAAEKEIEAAQKIYDDYPYNLNNLGLLYLKKGDPAAAEKQFKYTIIKHPDCFEAIDNLALTYFLEGKFAAAARLWTVIYGSGPAEENLALRFQGDLAGLVRQGKKEEAEKVYRAAKELIGRKELLLPLREIIN